MDKAWKMENAEKNLNRERLSRMEIIKQFAESDKCAEDCAGEWLVCAKEVLTNNNVHPYVYADALKE